MVFSSLIGANQEHEIVKKVDGIIAATHDPKFQQVWPGFDFSTQATLVTFRNGHLYALDFKSKTSDWTVEKIGQKDILFNPKDTISASQFPFQPHFNLEGNKAYAFSMDPVLKGDQNAYHVFVHERFHTYQFQNFHKQPKGRYFDQWNPENLTLVKLEERALIRFFKGQGEGRKEFLKDFIAIHQMRELLIHPASVIWEGHEQTMEGLAEYVSFKLFDTFPNLQVRDGKEKMVYLLQMYEANPEVAERVVKWRHYGVGAALAYALDELGVKDWKRKVEEQGVTLAELVQAALPMSAEEVQERYQTWVESAYQYELAKGTIEAGVRDYHQTVKNTLQNFEERKGILVSVSPPRIVAVSGQGLTDRQISLPNGTQVSLRDSSVFTTSDRNWRLELKDHPQVFQTFFGSREFKCDDTAKIWLDGEEQQLSAIAELGKEKKRFQTLRIEGQGTLFESSVHAGELFIDEDGAIVIQYP